MNIDKVFCFLRGHRTIKPWDGTKIKEVCVVCGETLGEVDLAKQ